MELPRLLIDTSIIVEHLRKRDRRKSILYRMLGEGSTFALWLPLAPEANHQNHPEAEVAAV